MSPSTGESDKLSPGRKLGMSALVILAVLAASLLVFTDVLPWYLASVLLLVVTAPISWWLDYRKRRRAYFAEARAQQDGSDTDRFEH